MHLVCTTLLVFILLNDGTEGVLSRSKTVYTIYVNFVKKHIFARKAGIRTVDVQCSMADAKVVAQKHTSYQS